MIIQSYTENNLFQNFYDTGKVSLLLKAYIRHGLNKFKDRKVNLLNIMQIERVVCEHCGITDTDLLKIKSHKRCYSYCRQLIYYFCKDYTNLTQKTQGSYFNNQDHSTVEHGVKTITNLCENNKEVIFDVSEIKRQLDILVDSYNKKNPSRNGQVRSLDYDIIDYDPALNKIELWF